MDNGTTIFPRVLEFFFSKTVQFIKENLNKDSNMDWESRFLKTTSSKAVSTTKVKFRIAKSQK